MQSNKQQREILKNSKVHQFIKSQKYKVLGTNMTKVYTYTRSNGRIPKYNMRYLVNQMFTCSSLILWHMLKELTEYPCLQKNTTTKETITKKKVISDKTIDMKNVCEIFKKLNFHKSRKLGVKLV